jgi:hypothetical protein
MSSRGDRLTRDRLSSLARWSGSRDARSPRRACSCGRCEKAERNRRSFSRLSTALPAIFPPAVLARALDRPFIPPTPRLAIESYWRAHPIRADRLARALSAKSGSPIGWTWRISQNRKTGRPVTFRMPPAPYRERAYSLGPGFCCVCGQPVYKLAWHRDLWDAGPNKKAVWHCACVIAWQFWNAPNSEAALLRRLQGRRCGPNRWTALEGRRGGSPGPIISCLA